MGFCARPDPSVESPTAQRPTTRRKPEILSRHRYSHGERLAGLEAAAGQLKAQRARIAG
jgi:hypothetical protein